MPARTPRLDLLPADAAALRAEIECREALAQRLALEIPDSWPPLLRDARGSEPGVVRYRHAPKQQLEEA